MLVPPHVAGWCVGVAEDVVGFPRRGGQSAVMEGGVLTFCSFEGDGRGVCGFVGVGGRIVVEGERGEEGRWKGEVRGEPKERGEGL